MQSHYNFGYVIIFHEHGKQGANDWLVNPRAHVACDIDMHAVCFTAEDVDIFSD
jgi:hypothetical protein